MDKLDVKSQKCNFIGYGGDEFGNCFWDDKNKKVIKSRDVVFNEKLMYKDKKIANRAVGVLIWMKIHLSILGYSIFQITVGLSRGSLRQRREL